MKITYLNREDIDAKRWDEVIANSRLETLYPYSWYLDAAADHWSALVMDNYRFIMPVAWKKRFGIRYLYQPLYCQQLGIFSPEVPEPFVTGQFLKRLMEHFRAGVYQFNSENTVTEQPSVYMEARTNFTISLDREYSELARSYSTNHKRNLKRATGIRVVEKRISLEELMALKAANDPVPKKEARYLGIKKQLEAVMAKDQGRIYGVRGEGGLEAAAFLAFSRTRILYLMSVSSAEGKERRAMFRIVDEVIREFSERSLILDFEGSSIPPIARFFSGFGALPETYQSVWYNRLPLYKIPGRKNAR